MCAYTYMCVCVYKTYFMELIQVIPRAPWIPVNNLESRILESEVVEIQNLGLQRKGQTKCIKNTSNSSKFGTCIYSLCAIDLYILDK